MLENEKQPTFIKWDLSIIIALTAVLISTMTAYISYQESKIMLAQQKNIVKSAGSVRMAISRK